jgi:hypothetical protein
MALCRTGNRDYGARLKNAVFLAVPVYKLILNGVHSHILMQVFSCKVRLYENDRDQQLFK